MGQSMRNRMRTHRTAGGIAATAFALGGLAASFLAVGPAGAATQHASGNVKITTVKNKAFGTILVSSGKTVYTLKASKTACTSACIQVWPELLLPKGVTKATAGSGAKASLLGSVARSGGERQVTYNGKPLYWFVGDKAGQVNGNITDTWGRWSDVVTAKPATSSGGATTPTTAPHSGGTAF